jgi:FlaA1/EpsC-like NDP-sugar epimerase
MSRFNPKFAGQVLIDLVTLVTAFGVAHILRFEWPLGIETTKHLLFQWPYVVIFELAVLYAMGAWRLVWRFLSLRDAVKLGLPVLVFTTVLFVARLVSASWGWAYASYALVPIGVIMGNAVLAYCGIVGARVLRRLHFERAERLNYSQHGEPRRVLLVGAGRAGQLAASEIEARRDLGMQIVGFIDDDLAKVGTTIHGIKVLGTSHELTNIVANRDVAEVIISMARVGGDVVRRIADLCKLANVPIKIIPGLYEIIGGRVSFSRIRDVQIEDLLGRDPVTLDADSVRAFLRGKTILVTGAGGSIGSEICRQVLSFEPAKLVLVERAEPALFEIYSELSDGLAGAVVVPRIADIADRQRMDSILEEHPCHVIFHAAAHKHVPMMEWNPGEAIKNNVLGTMVVADLAAARRVGHLVLISTDKAVRPASVMGASKRVAELYIQRMAQEAQHTRFVAVRFGNVLGSAGSVIPTFKRQIAKGGPITITDPEMQRYFMTIPEATQLVLQAGAIGKGGEVFILQMGKPVRIVDLAKDLIRLSGLEPDKDIKIVYSGLRPGEKLFEDLATDEELAERTPHEKILIGRVKAEEPAALERGINALLASANKCNHEEIAAAFRALIPESAIEAGSCKNAS